MIPSVIIDDVKKARQTLQADLRDYCPEVKIIGEADGVVNGAKVIRNLKPELVFLDIQMQDGSGFDLLEIVDPIDFKIIFTTASDAFAIRAFKYAAIDYLLKPIDPDELKLAVKKAADKQTYPRENIDLLLDNMKSRQFPDRIALITQEKIHVTKIEDILRCESNVNYTMFYFTNGKKLIVTKTLKEFDGMLKDRGFVRVHQSHLINSKYIKEYVKVDGGYIVMTDDTPVPVSGRKKQMIVELISNM